MLSSYVMVILYSEQSAFRYIQVKLDICGVIYLSYGRSFMLSAYNQ